MKMEMQQLEELCSPLRFMLTKTISTGIWVLLKSKAMARQIKNSNDILIFVRGLPFQK